MAHGKPSGFIELVKTVAYAVLIALVVRTFAYEPFSIPSGSMIPTLLVGDYLFVSKFSYGYSRYSLPFGLPLISGRVFASEPERGDVAVFKLPSDNKTDYIKRVIGLPGDRIQVVGGRLLINGQEVPREPDGYFAMSESGENARRFNRYIETLPNGRRHEIIEFSDNSYSDDTPVYVVPEGMYFAMGDNRDSSKDSRFPTVGFVPFENLVGRAEFIFFSIDGSPWRMWEWFQTLRVDRIFQGIQ